MGSSDGQYDARMLLDHGTLDDVRARLEDLKDSDRRLIPVFGSGMSNAVLPDVVQMISLFAQASGLDDAEMRERFRSSESDTERYQLAASILKHRRGDVRVASVIREAALRACLEPCEVKSEENCRALLKAEKWNIPQGYLYFAEYFRQLPESNRGPIITTNFDPLIEMALDSTEQHFNSFPLGLSEHINDSMLREVQGIPILHIHGYWTSSTTLNTVSQLNRERSYLDSFLRSVMRGATILVLGYSGWNDSFMKVLEARSRELDLMDSEILWCSYSSDPSAILGNSTLERMSGSPHVNFYLGIDGNEVFTPFVARDAGAVQSVRGFEQIAANSQSSQIAIPSLLADAPVTVGMVDGWPLLSSAAKLMSSAQSMVDGDQRTHAIVALGPMGEGKSMALRQVADRLLSYDIDNSIVILWRLPGAPIMNREFFEGILSRYSGKIILCIDDADLVLNELKESAALWSAENSRIFLLLAAQDRIWVPRSGSIPATPIFFHGIESSDAHALAKCWGKLGLREDLSAAELEAQVLRSAHALTGTRQGTLFGSMLEVLPGQGLKSRVEDLLERLKNLKVSDLPGATPVYDAFAAICVMQELYDPDASVGRGILRDALARTISIDTGLIDGKILRELGKEVAITISGEHVYSRHPMIARVVVEILRESADFDRIVRLVGRAGGRLRFAKSGPPLSVNYEYLLFKKLRGVEAVNAAEGAVEGAGRAYLEPRVSLLSTKRAIDSAVGYAYAKGLMEHVSSFEDVEYCYRGLLVEASYCAHSQGERRYALQLGICSVLDGFGRFLDLERASYGLRCVSLMLRDDPSLSSRRELQDYSYEIFYRLFGVEEFHQRLPWARGFEDRRDGVRELSASTLVERFVLLAAPIVNSLLVRLPEGPRRAGCHELLRLLEAKSR